MIIKYDYLFSYLHVKKRKGRKEKMKKISLLNPLDFS